MKVAVCVKQVLEVSRYLEFTADGTRIDPAFVTAAVNEADLCAVEEGLSLVEAAGEGEVVLVGVGDEGTEEALRAALALGPQRALRVWADGLATDDVPTVAAALVQAIEAESPDLVLCGVQSADTGQQSTGPAVAAAWGVPCVPVAHGLSVSGATLRAHREFEGGVTETVEVDLPAVVTIQVGANTPRYGTFKDKMRAKKAEIPVIAPSGLAAPRTVVVRLTAAAGGSGRSLQMIDGGPADVAARILELVRQPS
jgi:electron transfer flavoprotein beta subunit